MIPVEFPPGVTNLASKNAKTTNWRECHLIRWHEGTTMRPVGGWEKIVAPPPAFASKVRKMHRWAANNGIIYNAYLCEQHCYVELEGVFVDITPVGGIVPPATNQGGYGNDKYGALKYGTPRPGENRTRLYTPIFSLDNWGEELRVMTSSDGRYLGWSPSAAPGTLLTAVTGAPTGNRAFVITPERHAMLFGMNAFDVFGWSDEEDDTNWLFADITSRAGFYDVSPKSPIITQQLFFAGIVMFTSTMDYLIEWSGLPYTYVYKPIGKMAVPISPASICETPDGVVWPSVDGWWLFDGNTASIIECPVWDFIIDNMNIDISRYSAACVHLASQGEVWWFYADKTASTFTNNRYVALDYRSQVWSMGSLSRTCGYSYANDVFPIMSDGVDVFKHESGFFYEDAELPWIESMNLTPNGGENWFTVNKILPDIQGDPDAIRFRMAKTNDRSGYTPEVYSPQRAKNGSGYVDIRETARDMRLRIDMVTNENWGTIGPILFDNKTRGKK